MAKTFYVTTPIYYVNDVPHIGHAYTTIAADVLARYRRLCGDEVFFLTGTDEHGQKIEQAAQEKGETPQELADRVVIRFKELCTVLNISNDDFIRTTDQRHQKAVEAFYRKVKENGDIYLGKYEGWYCTSDEMFVTDSQLDEQGKYMGKEVKKLKEASYFFKLSKYQDYLLEFFQKDTVLPKSKANEIRSFVEQGLRDLSISRTTFDWGIQVPDDPEHVIYVWFDALFNYISALNWNANDNDLFEKFWPADVHFVGKDILRFHSVYWPAFLKSAGIETPRKIFAHGWWTVDGKKMSKSLGNVVDPFEISKTYGVDAFRYFLLREVPFGNDGNFSIQALEQRINADLANDLGNLYSRTLGMYKKYFKDEPLPYCDLHFDSPSFDALRKICVQNCCKETMDSFFNESFNFQEALKKTWEVIAKANLFIDQTQPWSVAKEATENEEKKKELSAILSHLLETLRIVSYLIFPFMPEKAEQIHSGLGLEGAIANCQDLFSQTKWGQYPTQSVPQKTPPLFPRIEMKKK